MNSLLKSFFLILLAFISVNQLGAQWVQVTSPGSGTVYVLAELPGRAGGSSLYAGTDQGVFLSNDRGGSWTSCNAGLPNSRVVRCFASSGTILFAGTQSGSVFRSENGGSSWSPTASLPGSTGIYDMVVSGTGLFAIAEGGGIFRSTDNGTSWAAVNVGLNGYQVIHLAAIGTNLFGAGAGGVFRSTNAGATWSDVNSGLADTQVGPLGALGANLFASTWHGIYRSTNYGTSWSPTIGLGDGFDYPVQAYATSGTDIFVACNIIGVFLSRDNGASWSAVNTGLGMPYPFSLAATSTDLYTGILLGGVWRRPLAEMLTGIDELRTDIPTNYSLEQNYPNPFNPKTGVRFQVPGVEEAGGDQPASGLAGGRGSGTSVKLAVYDLLGREVAVLVNERKAPGSYEVGFDGTGLASGVYFYRLTAGDFIETKRMMLVK